MAMAINQAMISFLIFLESLPYARHWADFLLYINFLMCSFAVNI